MILFIWVSSTADWDKFIATFKYFLNLLKKISKQRLCESDFVGLVAVDKGLTLSTLRATDQGFEKFKNVDSIYGKKSR